MSIADEPVLVLADDLFARSRIDAAAQASGRQIRYLRSSSDLAASIEQASPRLLIVGMAATRQPWPDLIRQLRAVPGGARTYVLAFGPHKDLAARRQALEAGADRVVANSAFMRALPVLLGAPDAQIQDDDES